jgi:hypothetical protein
MDLLSWCVWIIQPVTVKSESNCLHHSGVAEKTGEKSFQRLQTFRTGNYQAATPAQGAAPAGIAGEAEKIKQNIANNANDLRVFLCLLSNLFHQESFVKKGSPVLGGKISITKVTKEHKGEIHICVLVFPSCCSVLFVVKMVFSVNNGRPKNSIANLSRSPKSVWDKSADLSH